MSQAHLGRLCQWSGDEEDWRHRYRLCCCFKGFEEETSQKDYERLMADSQATRAQNVESITDKEGSAATWAIRKILGQPLQAIQRSGKFTQLFKI